jgi:hypothetical protein
MAVRKRNLRHIRREVWLPTCHQPVLIFTSHHLL